MSFAKLDQGAIARVAETVRHAADVMSGGNFYAGQETYKVVVLPTDTGAPFPPSTSRWSASSLPRAMPAFFIRETISSISVINQLSFGIVSCFPK